MQDISAELSYSETSINRDQRNAIVGLAGAINALEQAAYEKLRAQALATVAIPGDLNLLGTNETARQIATALSNPAAPSLHAIQGVGGIGKTSLAYEVMLRPEIVSRFKPEFVACDAEVSAETITEHIINELASKPHINCQGSPSEKRHAVQHKLRTVPHLVVIDNLESLAVVDALVKQLPPFAGKTCFLLTTREFQETAKVRSHHLQELDAATSAALMQRIASEKSIELSSAEAAALYNRIGGNPYAIELVIPLLRLFPAQIVVDDLAEANLNETQALYDHIFTRVWATLDTQQQQLLLPLHYQGGIGISADALLGMSGLPASAFWNCVQALTNRSLLNPISSASGQRFSLHRLLASFIKTKVLA